MIQERELTTEAPRMQRMVVTPDLAAKWLKRNLKDNRSIKRPAIDRYKRAMLSGDWTLNGEPLIFRKDGVLLDGQNRLIACIESKCSFETFVVWGVDRDAMSTINTGVPRKVADILKIESAFKNTVGLAAAAGLAWKYDQGKFPNFASSPSADEIIDYIERNPKIQDAVTFSRSFPKFMALSIIGACYFLFSRQDETKAHAFFLQLKDGAGLEEQSPVLALRNRLLANRDSRSGKLTRQMVIALLFKAWVAFREDRPVKNLRLWSVNEEFPTIE